MPRIRLFAGVGRSRKTRIKRRKRNPELAAVGLNHPVPAAGPMIPVRLRIQRLPEGVYLATSDDIQGLVVQGRTVAETLEFAEDAARRLTEARWERARGKPTESTILVRM